MTVSVPYPVEASSNTADQASVWYYIVCPGMKGDAEQEHLIDHAASLPSDPASPLMIELRKTFPSGPSASAVKWPPRMTRSCSPPTD